MTLSVHSIESRAGMQILARPFDEGLLIGLAYVYEQKTHHRVPLQLFPELRNGREQ